MVSSDDVTRGGTDSACNVFGIKCTVRTRYGAYSPPGALAEFEEGRGKGGEGKEVEGEWEVRGRR